MLARRGAAGLPPGRVRGRVAPRRAAAGAPPGAARSAGPARGGDGRTGPPRNARRLRRRRRCRARRTVPRAARQACARAGEDERSAGRAEVPSGRAPDDRRGPAGRSAGLQRRRGARLRRSGGRHAPRGRGAAHRAGDRRRRHAGDRLLGAGGGRARARRPARQRVGRPEGNQPPAAPGNARVRRPPVHHAALSLWLAPLRRRDRLRRFAGRGGAAIGRGARPCFRGDPAGRGAVAQRPARRGRAGPGGRRAHAPRDRRRDRRSAVAAAPIRARDVSRPARRGARTAGRSAGRRAPVRRRLSPAGPDLRHAHRAGLHPGCRAGRAGRGRGRSARPAGDLPRLPHHLRDPRDHRGRASARDGPGRHATSGNPSTWPMW